MSTVTVQTISNGTVSTSTANVINGAKAWVNFNGSTAAIRASYNVSSITKNGTGDYTLNFTNAFADSNYCLVAATGNNTNPATSSFVAAQVELGTLAAQTTTSVRIGTGRQYSGYTAQDLAQVNIAIFR